MATFKLHPRTLITLLIVTPMLYASAATITVTNTNDSGAGSLRAAIASANSGDTINFDSSLNGQTITLTSGELAINKSLTIQGPGANLLTISGNNATRVFEIASGVTATIESVTIANGMLGSGSGGGILVNGGATLTVTGSTVSSNTAGNSGGGAGIANFGALTVTGSTISNNSETITIGGGFYNTGTLIVTNSTISNNSASSDGGGIFNQGVVTISSSTISGGSGGSFGGGIENNSGSFTLVNSTISNNTSDVGAGIYNPGGALTVINSTISNNTGGEGSAGITNYATLILNNSTISNNKASERGGGLENAGTANLSNCTFFNNSATFGAAIFNYGTGQLTITSSTIYGNTAQNVVEGAGGISNRNGGSVSLADTIIAGNVIAGIPPAPFDVIGAFNSQGNNLIGDTDNSSGWVGTDLTGTGSAPLNPVLGALQNNGGPTPTIMPQSGSPAIGAGSVALAVDQNGNALLTDQRGAPRVVNGKIDVGAVQTGQIPQTGPSFVVTNTGDWDSGVCSVGFCSLREAINAANAYNGAATVTFNNGGASGGAVNFYDGNQHTITLNGNELLISGGNVTIQGPGANVLTVSGNNTSRVFDIESAITVTLNGLTIANGKVNNGFTVSDGGGIKNFTGTLTINDCALTNNSATGTGENQGGGISNADGTLVINNSTLSLNYASATSAALDAGGGIYNFGATLVINNSTLYGNYSGDSTASVVYGGGIFNFFGTLTVTNSTIYGNSANGAAGKGGGISNKGGKLNFANTIIANSPQGQDYYGDSNSMIGTNSSNFVGDGGDGSFTPAYQGNPMLSPLGNYGGPTQTLVPLTGSPVIGAGNGAFAVDENNQPLATDQRGFARTRTANINNGIAQSVDIGAVEAAYTTLFSGSPTVGQPYSVSVLVTNATTPGSVQLLVDGVAPQGSVPITLNGAGSFLRSGSGLVTLPDTNSHTITAIYTNSGGSAEGNSNSLSQTANRANTTTMVQCPSTEGYTGNAFTPCTATVTGPNGFSQSLSVNYSNNTNAGTAGASASFAGNSNYAGSTGSATFQITPASTMVAVQCPSAGQTFTNSAITPCSATVTGPGLSQSLPVTYMNNVNVGTASASANYAGTNNYKASSGNGTFSITKAGVTVNVTAANAIYDGHPHGETATVTGVGGLNQSLPVSYAGSNGTVYGPSATAPTTLGNYIASASFAGDANHNAGSGSAAFQITAQVVNFVVGDNNAVVGKQVTFWGSQWAKNNSLSGGSSAPSSFKGYADSASSNPPTCGGSWTANPGGSSNPPATLPQYITVIVSSSITKSGSVISGNIRQTAVIQVNPGYTSSSGIGTVISVGCGG